MSWLLPGVSLISPLCSRKCMRFPGIQALLAHVKTTQDKLALGFESSV